MLQIQKSKFFILNIIIRFQTNITIGDSEGLLLEAQWTEVLKSVKIVSSENVSVYERINKLKKLPIFQILSDLKIMEFANRLKKGFYKQGDEIVKEGTIEDKFFIIYSGKVKLYQNKKLIRELEAFNCFGEAAFLGNILTNSTMIASEDVECYYLGKDDFSYVVDVNMFKYLQKVISLQDMSINLNQLYYIRTLGSGRYGKVVLTHNKRNMYALKIAKIKWICNKTNLIQYYLQEKKIMSKIDFPFIVKLVKTLKNENYLFFLLEFIDGISLKSHLDKRTKKVLRNKYEAQFYGAILLFSIDYLHRHGIIHRDIKADNCLIDTGVSYLIKVFIFKGIFKINRFWSGKRIKRKGCYNNYAWNSKLYSSRNYFG